MSDLEAKSSSVRNPSTPEEHELDISLHNKGSESNASSRSQDQDTEKTQIASQANNETLRGSEVPDGGLAAWLVVFGTWCTSFCSFGWLNSVGVFQEYYQNDLLKNYSASTISWIPSLQIFFMMGMGPIVGFIYDRYGPRWLLLGGSLLHVFGIMMTSLGTEYYQILLAQGLCSAIGVSAIFQPSIICAAGWFNKKRGAVFGLIFTGSSVGGIIFPIMISRLIDQVGFGWSMRISAFLIGFLLVIANLTVRAFSPPRPYTVTLGQLLKPLTEVEFLAVTTGLFLFSYGAFVPLNYLPSQVLDAGMSQNLAQYILPILNAGSLFGRLSSGIISDKFGHYNMFIVVSFLSGIFCLGIWLPASSNAALIVFAVLFGFVSGAYVSLITPLVMKISPMPELGFRSGIVFFAISIGGLTANPINGAILDGTADGWMGLKIFSGVFCFAGAFCIFAARFRQTGRQIFVKF